MFCHRYRDVRFGDRRVDTIVLSCDDHCMDNALEQFCCVEIVGASPGAMATLRFGYYVSGQHRVVSQRTR